MDAFVSGLKGVLLIEVLVVESRNSFGVVRRDPKASKVSEELKEELKGELKEELKEPLLHTLWKERVVLKDNTTLGKKLKEISENFPDAHVLLAPPKIKVSEEHISPIIRKLSDHIAIMRHGSAIMLDPASQSDLKIDDKSYLVIPPRLLADYAHDAPEPLHLLLYVLAIIVTCIVLSVIYYRTKRTT